MKKQSRSTQHYNLLLYIITVFFASYFGDPSFRAKTTRNLVIKKSKTLKSWNLEHSATHQEYENSSGNKWWPVWNGQF